MSLMSLVLNAPAWLLFAAAYLVAFVAYLCTSRLEFKRSPEKGKRYRALPVGYKLACWFGVIPLFAGTAVNPLLFPAAVVAFMAVEAACVRWYRKAGWLPH